MTIFCITLILGVFAQTATIILLVSRIHTLLGCLAHFPLATRVFMLKEDPRAHIVVRFLYDKSLPPEFNFLSGAMTDLGFENLSLDRHDLWKLHKALAGTGIAIPHSRYRVRLTPMSWLIIEPKDGSEAATLPENWKQAILVLGHNDEFTWVGRLVRQDQLPPYFNHVAPRYVEHSDGWKLQ
jgi:hypothetical protein